MSAAVGCVLLLPALAGAAPRYLTPQRCISVAKMRRVLQRFAPPPQAVECEVKSGHPYCVWTRQRGGEDVSEPNRRDPLLNHIPQLIAAGIEYNVEPRFQLAIASAESSMGTDPKASPKGQPLYGNNPWGYGAKDANWGTVDESIRKQAFNIQTWISRHCDRIDDYADPNLECGKHAWHEGPAGRERWREIVKSTYGNNPVADLGAEPETYNLTYEYTGGLCEFADCNYDGEVSVNELITVVGISPWETSARPPACPAPCRFMALVLMGTGEARCRTPTDIRLNGGRK